MNKIVFEVGANKGTDTSRFLADGSLVYAFEPTPELILELKNKLLPLKIRRFITKNLAEEWDVNELIDLN